LKVETRKEVFKQDKDVEEEKRVKALKRE